MEIAIRSRRPQVDSPTHRMDAMGMIENWMDGPCRGARGDNAVQPATRWSYGW